VVTDNKEEKRPVSGARDSLAMAGKSGVTSSPPVLQKESQIYLKHSLEKSHVCSLVQTNLVLPNVHNLRKSVLGRDTGTRITYQDLTRRQREKRALTLKVLVFTTLTAIGTFHVHNEDVLAHVHAFVLLCA
jgi:hypothetical protein